jgi:hypothetical protein
MALPTLDKTWIFKVIQLPSFGGGQADYTRLIWTIRNALVQTTGWTDNTGAPTTNAHPWVLMASSNGSVANTSDNWTAVLTGTDTSANVNTSVNNTLRIRVGSAYNVYTVMTVTVGASTAKTTIQDDLNNNAWFSGLGLVASITGTNQLTISDTGTSNFYIEIDTAANGSTLNTSCGFGDGPPNNRITTWNKIQWGTSIFSWVILQQPAINPNFQLCFGTSTASPSYHYFTSLISPVAGFTLTGLTTSAAPVAPDRVQFHANTQIHGGGAAAFDFVLYVMMSTDGECTRLMGWNNASLKTFWMWEKPKNPVSGWLNPAIYLMNPNSGLLWPSAYTELTAQALVGARILNQQVGLYVTTEFYGSAALGVNLQSQNEVSGEWAFTPSGLGCSTPGLYGRHGEIYDFWWTSSAIYSGMSFPSSGNRRFMTIGHAVIPWNRSVLINS